MEKKRLQVLFIGGTAQARLCHHMLRGEGYRVPFVFDQNPNVKPHWETQVFHDESAIPVFARSCDAFLVCIGGEHGERRSYFSRLLLSLGLEPLSVIHPTAFIGETVARGRGMQVMPSAVVHEFTSIGDWCIVNSNATIDHDCRIGEGVHIMGGAALASGIVVDDYATVGTNATIVPNLRIGARAFVGAGAVVIEDVAEGAVVVGNPAARRSR